MSKNGLKIFKTFDPIITSPYGYRTSPFSGKIEFHEATDYGTNNKTSAQYALEQGKILAVGTDGLGGKFVYVEYPRLGYVGLHYHLSKINVKTGDNVDNNTIIGLTGATGLATGIHLHYGWFKKSEYNKSFYSRNWEDFEEYQFPSYKIGTPVLKDNTKDQIEVLIDNLRGRLTPNGEILGLLNKGFYNYTEISHNGLYDWYKIDNNLWCAYDASWIKRTNGFKVGDIVYPIQDVTLTSTAGYKNSVSSIILKGTKCIVYKFHSKNGLYMALKDESGNVLSPAAWTKEFNLFEKRL